MNKKHIDRLAITGMTAGIYVVLTLLFPIASYGYIQYRVAEILNLLVFFNPIFAPGIIIGCLIANMFSPYLIFDMIFGTTATVCTMFAIRKLSPNLFVASLWPTFFCFFVGFTIMITTVDRPNSLSLFLYFTGFVMVGEFAVMTLTAYPLFKILMKRYPKAVEIIKNVGE
jgi:uncharacterized membrane protein